VGQNTPQRFTLLNYSTKSFIVDFNILELRMTLINKLITLIEDLKTIITRTLMTNILTFMFLTV